MTHDMTGAIDLSFVVIGYNEAAHLEAALAAVRAADLEGLACELIYADGGSSDGSVAIARAAGVDRLLGGDKRRRAAENRNLGLHAARGAFVQFLDGDMAMHPDWPKAALERLRSSDRIAAVFGVLEERRQTVVYRAMQIDWHYPEGEALYCGGAAVFRTEPLRAFGGFPEDVAFGEEPYLCWRMRNEGGYIVYHLHKTMALHDLAFRGFADYWRRTMRVGTAFAEISHRCRGHAEPLWTREVRNNLLWCTLLAVVVVAFFFEPVWLEAMMLAVFAAVLARKTWQYRGHGWRVAFVYAVHTYLVKIAIGAGILRWRLARPAR